MGQDQASNDGTASGSQEAPGRAAGDPVDATPDGRTQLSAVNKNCVRVVQKGTDDFTLVTQAVAPSRTHRFEANVKKASTKDILEQMRDAQAGDIFTSDTHCHIPKDDVDENGKPRVIARGIMSFDDDASAIIWLADMVTALKTGTAPTAVVLCGCLSADLIKGLVATTDVKVAFGIGTPLLTRELGKVKCTASTLVARQITAALMLGNTIDDAVKLGDDELMAEGQSIEIAVADGVQSGLSLAGNRLL